MTVVEERTDTRRSQEIEAFLSARNVEWHFYPSVNLDQIDVPASRRNQARVEETVDPELVAKYRRAHLNGDVFPPLIAREKPGRDDIYILMDGNHRDEVYRSVGVSSTPLYLVRAEPEMLQVLTFEFNRRNGAPTTREDAERHGIYLVESGTMSAGDAANVVGLSRGSLQNAISLAKANSRARVESVRGWQKIGSNDNRREIAKISTDAGFRAFARLVIDLPLTGAEVREGVKRVNSVRSDEGQVTVVDQYREEVKIAVQKRGGTRGGGSRALSNPRAYTKAHLVALMGIDPHEVVRATLTEEQRAELATLAEEVSLHTQDLAETLRQFDS